MVFKQESERLDPVYIVKSYYDFSRRMIPRLGRREAGLPGGGWQPRMEREDSNGRSPQMR